MNLTDWGVSMHGPKHASHLPVVDLETVIGKSDMLHAPVSEAVDVPSLRNHLSDCALDLRALLLQACHNICHETFKLEASVASTVAALKPSNEQKLEIVLVGRTTRSGLFQRLLSSSGIHTKICEDSHTEPSSDTTLSSLSGSIAVVGMAGRFPGSDDVEQFWESLLSRKEYHERVCTTPYSQTCKVLCMLTLTGASQSIRPLDLASSKWRGGELAAVRLLSRAARSFRL